MFDAGEHRLPDHPRTFMKMISQVHNPCVVWDGSIDRYEACRTKFEGYLTQNFRLYTLEEEKTVMLMFWMKYHQLPKLRKMHVPVWHST
jgi:hypothetical protein